MVKMVFLDPPVKGGKKIRRHLDRVGLKNGFDSWFVEEKDLPILLLLNAAPNVSIVKMDGRTTLNSLRRHRESARRDLEI